MLGFLFVDDATFRPDPDDAARLLGAEAAPALTAARDALAGLGSWDAAGIEAVLRGALVEGLGLKPKLAFGPVRVAVTGRRVSPPLFESLELLGPERTLARLGAALG
jgi:glutamyl-tRNA synthetase